MTAVVQFGLAMIPWCSRTSAPLISGTTSGTWASIRKALELSTTTHPAFTASGAYSREMAAPALNSATVKGALKVESSNPAVPVATMVKKHGGATYVFAVAMKPGATEAGFTLEGHPAGAQVEVLGEGRKIEPAQGKFQDHFADWDVHLYRIK